MPPPKHTFAEQEKLILTAAAKCIEESSLIDFKMSSISKEAGLSMGSIYKHVQSKEDVLLGLAAMIGKHAVSVINEVLSMPNSLQIKLIMMQIISPKAMFKYPFGQQLFMMLNHEVILTKVSERWLRSFLEYNSTIEQEIRLQLVDAINSGDLQCSEEDKTDLIEEIMIAQWSLNVGFPQTAYHALTYRLLGEEVSLPYPLQLSDPIIRASIRYISSYPWKNPLDMEELRVVDELMAEKGFK